jgi:hypothetical protein
MKFNFDGYATWIFDFPGIMNLGLKFATTIISLNPNPCV